MSNESLEIFAKHFGKNLNLDIEFQDGACPSTNGKKIILPSTLNEKYLLQVLGALIHETGHVRLTDFESFTNELMRTSVQTEENFKSCFNVLEDIRVDYMTTEKYQETKGLLLRLISWVTTNQKDLLMIEPIQVKILKTLYLKSLGIPGYDDIADKAIKDHNLDRFITLAKSTGQTTSVFEIIQHAKDLQALLWDMPWTPEELSKLEEYRNKYTEYLKKNKEELSKKLSEADKGREECLDKLTEAQTALEKAKAKASRRRLNLSKADTKQKEAKADQALDEAEFELEKATECAKEARKEFNDKHRLVKDIQNKHEKVRERLYKSESQEYLNETRGGYGTDLSGFGALESIMESITKVTFTKSTEEAIREYFLNKREDQSLGEEGSRLSPRKIPGIFTNDTDIFQEVTEENQRTVITFLVDSSGSMGHVLDTNSRADICLTSLIALLEPLDRIITGDNLPIEFSVVSFNTGNVILKPFSAKFNSKNLKDRYKTGGGTDIIWNLRAVEKDMKAYCPEESARRVIILLTDGEVSACEIEEINNDKELATVEILAVGIQLRNTSHASFKVLFRDRIIKNLSQILPVLTKTFMEGLK